MKMYILIKENVPDKMVPVIAAHASLACYKKFEDDPDMIEWINGIFRKVVCKVNEKEFANAQNEDRYILLTESTLDDRKFVSFFVQGQRLQNNLSISKCGLHRANKIHLMYDHIFVFGKDNAALAFQS